MYVLVHVEARYVAAFLVLFWCAIVCSLPVPRGLSSKWATVIAGVAIAALLLPLGRLIYPPA
jgi:hypothetical protein